MNSVTPKEAKRAVVQLTVLRILVYVILIFLSVLCLHILGGNAQPGRAIGHHNAAIAFFSHNRRGLTGTARKF